MAAVAEPTDAVLDAVAAVIVDSLQNTSTIARRAKVSYWDAVAALRWLVRERFIVAEGRGSWEKYRARRAGEIPKAVR